MIEITAIKGVRVSERITRILDIDGTIVKYQQSYEDMLNLPMEPLPGVLEKMNKWREQGDYILLTTARAIFDADRTIQQLIEAGIPFDFLVSGVTSGLRILYNDEKSYIKETARAYSIPRNDGVAVIQDDEYNEWPLPNSPK